MAINNIKCISNLWFCKLQRPHYFN